MVVFQVAVGVKLKASLLLHEVSVFLNKIASEHWLALRNLAIPALRQQRVRLLSPLLQLSRLCLIKQLSYIKLGHITTEVDSVKERMRFQCLHILGRSFCPKSL